MNHGGHNGQQDAPSNYPFAYTFSLPSEGNHDHDASRQALMNDEQQSYMDKFWEEPDQTTTNNTNEVLPFNFVGSGLNDKPDNNMNSFGLHMPNGMDFSVDMGFSGNHMSIPVPSAPRTVNHVAPAYLSQYDASKGFEDFVYQNDPTVTTNNSQRITHDDQAASTLMSMSSNSQEHSQPTAPSGSSWGNLNMNNSNNYSGDQLHMGGDPSSASTNTPLGPTITENFQRPGRATSHAQYQPHNLMQQATQAGNYAQARHVSLPMRNSVQTFPNQAEQWQMPNATNQNQTQTQRRPPIYQYGSDQNFSQQGYQATGYSTPDQQYNGLLNLPLAGVVSESTAPIIATHQAGGVREHSHQHRHSLPNNLQELSNAALAHQHASMQAAESKFPRSTTQVRASHAMENLATSQQSRKRRRSQPEDGSAMPYARAQDNAQNNNSTPMRAPAGVKQETSNDHYQSGNTASACTSNKRPRTSPRPATASATASASPSTPAATTLRASSSSKKRRSDAKQPRHNLTETQKRNNHIASEQKRRDAMKVNYEELNRYVPSLRQGTQGLSRSEILQHSGDWLQTLTVGNASIMNAYGLTFEDITDDDDDNNNESNE
ncbi:hypothetical protein MBLNU13_g01732t1 [Cladosporium sp. NU13]